MIPIVASRDIRAAALRLVRACGTRDPFTIAREKGVYIRHLDGLSRLLGMFTCCCRERHIILNNELDEPTARMVCAHELGHDIFHRELAQKGGIPEMALLDLRTRPEYEANAFAAHLLIDEDELTAHMDEKRSVGEIAALMGVHQDLLLIKLNEMRRLGLELDLPYIPRGDFLCKLPPHSV